MPGVLERAVGVQHRADHPDVGLLEQRRHLTDAVGLDQFRVVVEEQQQVT